MTQIDSDWQITFFQLNFIYTAPKQNSSYLKVLYIVR